MPSSAPPTPMPSRIRASLLSPELSVAGCAGGAAGACAAGCNGWGFGASVPGPSRPSPGGRRLSLKLCWSACSRSLLFCRPDDGGSGALTATLRSGFLAETFSDLNASGGGEIGDATSTTLLRNRTRTSRQRTTDEIYLRFLENGSCNLWLVFFRLRAGKNRLVCASGGCTLTVKKGGSNGPGGHLKLGAHAGDIYPSNLVGTHARFSLAFSSSRRRSLSIAMPLAACAGDDDAAPRPRAEVRSRDPRRAALSRRARATRQERTGFHALSRSTKWSGSILIRCGRGARF